MKASNVHNILKTISVLTKKYEQSFPMVLIVFGVLLVSLLMAPALFARPIADDFHYFNQLSSYGTVDYIVNFYTSDTGRYAQGASMAVLYKLFGSNSVVVGPIIEILLLIATTTWASFLLLRSFKVTTRRLSKALILGLTSTSVVLLYTPSLFDSLYWLTSSTVYVLSLVGLVFNFSLALYVLQLQRPRWWHYFLLMLSVIIGQAFSEATSAIIVSLSGIALLVAIILRQRGRNLKPSHFTSLTSVLVAAIIGFLIVYFSPGSRQRQAKSESQFDFHAMFVDSIHNTLQFLQTFVSWRLALIIAVALAVAHFLPRLSKKRSIAGLGIGLLLVVLPAYITFVISSYSMGTYIPFRLYTIPTAFTCIGLIIVTAIGCQWITRYFSKFTPPHLSLPLLCTVFAIAGYFSALPIVRDVLSAEILRSSLYDNRAASIASQLSQSNNTTVRVVPAPILLNESEAGDFSFKEKQISWFADSFKQYYNIDNKNVVIDSLPPAGYCLPEQAPTWYGAEICSRQYAR